jgi:Family of unknown function (DUF6174)
MRLPRLCSGRTEVSAAARSSVVTNAHRRIVITGMQRLVVLALVLAASCDVVSPEKIDFRQRALDETARQESLWKARAIHHYDFDFVRNCACDQVALQPVRIRVRNDAITRVLDMQGTDVPPKQGVSWPTVDSLFLWSRQVLNDRSLAVEMAFDSTFNFPSRIHAESPSTIIVHGSANLVVQTATAPIVE